MVKERLGRFVKMIVKISNLLLISGLCTIDNHHPLITHCGDEGPN
jgi:hypothetical protein